MNYKEIESLKSTLANIVREGCTLQVPSHGVNGKLIGIGFKPYWTNPVDSKIEKLQLDLIDSYGRIVPFNFFNVTGYDVISRDGQRLETSKNISLDIHVYSENKNRDSQSNEKIRITISGEAKK